MNSFLDLPVFSITDWLGGNKFDRRLPASLYRTYLTDYAKVVEIRKNIVCGLNVMHIEVVV